MKINFFIVFIVIGLLVGTLFAEDIRIIKPVKRIEDIMLTPSDYAEVSKLSEIEQKLLYLYYVTGFVDAVVLEEANAFAIKQFLQECEGMDMEQLVDTMLKFYRENPQWRDRKPSIVLTVVIPRLRRGLTPFPNE